MKNLKLLVSEYLKRTTDYALQIKGNWGSGKTFFYKNQLEAVISQCPITSNNEKKFKPVYVSLFGLKSVEEIQTKIVLTFYQARFFSGSFAKKNNKTLKITQNVFKIAFSGFLSVKGLGNFNDIVDSVKDIGKDALDTNELVVCFDDIERKSSSLNFEDFIGYVNSLVDEGVKVLMILNEKRIIEVDSNYKDLKEKVTGTTVVFMPDVKETLRSIIKSRYLSEKTFREYLIAEEENLISLVELIGYNFRHIIYALDCLRHCYDKIKKEIFDKKDPIANFVKKELNSISNLILAIAIEYKSSEITHDNLSDFYKEKLGFRAIFSKAAESVNADTQKFDKLYNFLKKYNFASESYHFYESIFNYVTGFDEFNIETFIGEFKRNFNLFGEDVPPQYKTLESLSYDKCFDLGYSDYKKKTLEMIGYAKRGEYSPSDYITIMHSAERMDNVLQLNLELTEKELTEGLKKAIGELSALTNLDDLIRKFSSNQKAHDNSSYVKNICGLAISELNLLKERRTQEKIKEGVTIFFTDFDKFKIDYKTDRELQGYFSLPFLSSIDTEELAKKLLNADFKELEFFRELIRKEYAKPGNSDAREVDSLKDLIANLKKMLEEMRNEMDMRIKVYVLEKFVNRLENCVN